MIDDLIDWNKFSTKTSDYREGYMDGYKIGLRDGLKHYCLNEASASKMDLKKSWKEIYTEESY